jgi:hypothetical protein
MKKAVFIILISTSLIHAAVEQRTLAKGDCRIL